MRRAVRGGSGLWSRATIRRSLATLDAGGPVVVLANREPFCHEHGPDGEVTLRRSASGLVTALEPLLEACGGTWVAHGGGSADRETVEARDGLAVPPQQPRYRLRRVWLDPDEHRRYYYGFANEALWPLCHRANVAPVFRADDFSAYSRVNQQFARAVCDEVRGDAPLVMVQDYHFALAPQMIRRRLRSSTIITFWHIPWPGAADFASCPWAGALLRGLLGSSIVGFHTDSDCDQFLGTVESLLDADVDRDARSVSYAGHTTMIRAYPISIEWPCRLARESPPIEACRAAVRQRLNCRPDTRLIVGVDRLDYTKGIPEKALAVERLLERRPEWRGRLVFDQIAEPSRDCLPQYRLLRQRVTDCIERINRRFGGDGYRPIVLREAHHEPAEVYEHLRAADVCFVGSLHDGMNLVAKEFVAARDDNRGALVLSKFTGAATQLSGALQIDPHAADDTAQTLARALEMTPAEQEQRMRSMRRVVATFNSYWWAGQMLRDAVRLRTAQRLQKASALAAQPLPA